MITLKQTLTAIKDGINKWDRKSRGDNVEGCALCNLYRKCSAGCPIYKKTGKTGCRGTPYSAYRDVLNRRHTIFNGEYILSQKAVDFRDWLKDLYIEVSEAGNRKKETGTIEETMKRMIVNSQRLMEKNGEFFAPYIPLYTSFGAFNFSKQKELTSKERLDKLEKKVKEIEDFMGLL